MCEGGGSEEKEYRCVRLQIMLQKTFSIKASYCDYVPHVHTFGTSGMNQPKNDSNTFLTLASWR